ncbi:uncharacterized protein VP01_1003g2 [Puccinia sorghi]|uniref:Uncharacterized protein n=1 Tax=Puccinia sorghi TaxID=27349 RepID=A0A0L6VWQ0_9BASI|nr:uncharacterized protein VP01_1003g2 [Puccinia sorghi]
MICQKILTPNHIHSASINLSRQDTQPSVSHQQIWIRVLYQSPQTTTRIASTKIMRHTGRLPPSILNKLLKPNQAPLPLPKQLAKSPTSVRGAPEPILASLTRTQSINGVTSSIHFWTSWIQHGKSSYLRNPVPPSSLTTPVDQEQSATMENEIPEQEQLPVALMIIFTGLQEVAARMASQPTPPPPPSATRSDPIKTPQSLQVFICSNICQILLKPDLQAYGGKPGAKYFAGLCSSFPFIPKQELIDTQDDCFHTANLPPNWRNDLQAVNELKTLITNILKAEKSFLGRIIKGGLVENKKALAPPLAKLVGDVYSQMHPQFKDATAHDINKDPLVTNAAKARQVYLRIMIHLNLLKLMMTLPHHTSKQGTSLLTCLGESDPQKGPSVMEWCQHCQQRECARRFSPNRSQNPRRDEDSHSQREGTTGS